MRSFAVALCADVNAPVTFRERGFIMGEKRKTPTSSNDIQDQKSELSVVFLGVLLFY